MGAAAACAPSRNMQEAGACAPHSIQTLVAGTAKASGTPSLNISSTMASFSVGVKLDLKHVARRGLNVEYNPKVLSAPLTRATASKQTCKQNG